MTSIHAGRYAAFTDQPLTVFLIGMRINKPLAVHKWLPVFNAMGPMLQTLYKHPEKGFLGGQISFYWPGVMLVQYWRSVEDLWRFAHDPSDPHLPAWRRFNQAVGGDGTVGIWHETFAIPAGGADSLYANMPRFGLGSVVEHVAATDKRVQAQKRAIATAAKTPNE